MKQECGNIYKELWLGDCMNMKRFLVLGVLGMFLVSMMGLVLGEDTRAGNPLGDIGKVTPIIDSGDSWIKDGFSNAKGWVTDNMKFTDIAENSDQYVGWIYALLLGMIIYTVISTFFAKSSKKVQWVITGAITAIAMMGIPGEVIASLESGYGAMGSAILAIIPFVIVFWFSVKVDSLPLAKGVWIFFAMYYATYAFIGFFSDAAEGAGWPYVIGLIGAIAMFYFMGFFRKKDAEWGLAGEIEKAEEKLKLRSARRKQSDKVLMEDAAF